MCLSRREIFFPFPDPEATLVGFLLLLHFRNKIPHTLELHRAVVPTVMGQAPTNIDLGTWQLSQCPSNQQTKRSRNPGNVLTERCVMEPSLCNSSNSLLVCSLVGPYQQDKGKMPQLRHRSLPPLPPVGNKIINSRDCENKAILKYTIQQKRTPT